MEVLEIEEAVRRKNEETAWRRWLALVDVARQRLEEEEKEQESEKKKTGSHHHQPSEGIPEIPRQPVSTCFKDEEAAAAAAAAVNVSSGSASKKPRIKIPRQPAAGSHHQPSEGTPECIKDEKTTAAAAVNVSARSTPSKKERNKIPRQPAAGSHHHHHQPSEGTPEMPEIFRRKIAEMGGENVTFVIEKKLYGTDISSQHNRLSMPMNQIRQDFVTEEERMRLDSGDANMNGIEVILVEPSLREEEVMLKRWRMKETSVIYVLIKNWHHIAKRNGLHAKDIVRVWTFRVQSKLSFAIVKVGKDEKGKMAAGKKNDGGRPERKEVVEYDGGSNNKVS